MTRNPNRNKQDVWNSRPWMIRKRNLIKGRMCLVKANLENLIQHARETELMELTDEEFKYLKRAIKPLKHLIKVHEKNNEIVLDKLSK